MNVTLFSLIFREKNLRKAPIVYSLMDAAIIRIFSMIQSWHTKEYSWRIYSSLVCHDSISFKNLNFCQRLLLDHAMQHRVKKDHPCIYFLYNCQKRLYYFIIEYNLNPRVWKKLSEVIAALLKLSNVMKKIIY